MKPPLLFFRTGAVAYLFLMLVATAPRPVVAQAGEKEGATTQWRVVVTTTGGAALAESGQAYDFQAQSVRAQVMGTPWGALDYQVDYLHGFQGGIPPGFAGTGAGVAGAGLYRYRSWRKYLNGEPGCTDPTELATCDRVAWFHEVDRAFAKVKAGSWQMVLGRFPIAWGAGRIWRPTDLFAAFSPLTLDTEFKPGVDGLRINWFPTDFSSVTLAHLASPASQPTVQDSTAAHYRTTLGDISELTLVAGQVRGKEVYGGSFETAFWNSGWRVEGLSFQPVEGAGQETFAVVGMDRQFSGNSSFLVELYHNTLGAGSEEELATIPAAPGVFDARLEGRMPYLSRNMAALGLQWTFGGLWGGGYSLVASGLRGSDGDMAFSHFHQAVLSYSISDEASATWALAVGNGKKSATPTNPVSEFGATPAMLIISVKFVL